MHGTRSNNWGVFLCFKVLVLLEKYQSLTTSNNVTAQKPKIGTFLKVPRTRKEEYGNKNTSMASMEENYCNTYSNSYRFSNFRKDF